MKAKVHSAEGFLSSTNDRSTARILTVDGEYTDINSMAIISTERLVNHESGLAVWKIDHTDSAPRTGRLVNEELDRMFVIEGGEQIADTAGSAAPHCPFTVPLRVCEESRRGPCFP